MKKINVAILLLLFTTAHQSCHQKTPQEKAQEKLTKYLEQRKREDSLLRKKTDSLLEVIDSK